MSQVRKGKKEEAATPSKELEYRHVFVNVYPSGAMGNAWDTFTEAQMMGGDGARIFCGKIYAVSEKPAAKPSKPRTPRTRRAGP